MSSGSSSYLYDSSSGSSEDLATEQNMSKPQKHIIQKLLWCHNSLLPLVMRQALATSHFTIVEESKKWIGYWGRHLKTLQYHTVMPHQKINHFPGAFHMGRKDRLWIHLQEANERFPEDDQFLVMPYTYILPRDQKKLKVFLSGPETRHVILKPPAAARGTGISIVSKFKQVPLKDPLIAQHYIENPLLINGSKFDLRLYVYVPCFDPLRIYLYEEGLVRFASLPYESTPGSHANHFVHLTNYSINKLAHKEGACDDPVPKWTLSELWSYMRKEMDVDVEKIRENIEDIVRKAVIACEHPIRQTHYRHNKYPFTSHELFGLDIMLDANLRPWLLEVNISPSLHSSTPIDVRVKAPLAKDVLNLCGIRLPPDEKAAHMTIDYTITPHHLSKCEDHLAKERLFVDHYMCNDEVGDDILQELTDSDVRTLIDFEDEYARRGNFKLIYPSEDTAEYLRFFQTPLYSNLFLFEWQCYQSLNGRQEGIRELDRLCRLQRHRAKVTFLEKEELGLVQPLVEPTVSIKITAASIEDETLTEREQLISSYAD
ncbi:hypothetical protein QR680_015144 [Steinernema hermaphroditum]|uniref:Tubulin-tyrosine ligase family protein n=1 Tax=Steinernema hermaphroditum TaxID=289476 RepID=A0AA39M4E8_9BILA|nr:hypothetical protein QR680_015144 [Steinernema hermaphroditum]